MPVACRHLEDAFGPKGRHQTRLKPILRVTQPWQSYRQERSEGRNKVTQQYKQKKLQVQRELNQAKLHNKRKPFSYTQHIKNQRMSHSPFLPNFPPDPLPQAHTPALPAAKVWSAPQLICFIGSSDRRHTGTGKKARWFSGTPFRSVSPTPSRPFAPWPHVYT